MTQKLQENHYYAFGMRFANVAGAPEYDNSYLFGGKALNTQTGLYDFHARLYDPVTCQWNASDPANQFTGMSVSIKEIDVISLWAV